jgi:low affinity Fe/Cu permease
MEKETPNLNEKEKVKSKKGRNFAYKIYNPNFLTWIIYVLLMGVLSIGYVFIIDSRVVELFLPPEIKFEFQLDEMIWGLFIPNLAIIIITPVVWDKISNLVLSNRWMKGFESSVSIDKSDSTDKSNKIDKKVGFMPFKRILGVKPKTNRHYYLEAYSVGMDLNKIKPTFSKKILGAISGSIGLTFLIAFVLNLVLTSEIMSDPLKSTDALFLSIMIMQIVPLFTSFLIPVNWVLNDISIRYITDTGFIEDLGENMSTGIFRRFIGIGGLILGINVCYDLAYNADAPILVNIWVTIVYFIFYFLLLNAGTLVLVSLLYLKFYHEKHVNSMRIKLTEYISLGETSVRSEIKGLDEQKISQGEKDIEQKSILHKIIKLILLLASISLIIYGQYYVLFIIGPFAL